MTLSLVLPCYNEEGNIARTVLEAQAWFASERIDGEILVVDDGSRDRTPVILSALRAEIPMLVVIHHEKNRGYGRAIQSGCDAARKECIAIMDSDGQFRAEDIALLFPLLATADFVAGRRRKRADPFVRKVTASLYGRLVRVVLGIRVRDINCGMKLFRRSLWPVIRPEHASGALFYAEMFLRLAERRIPWTQVPVPHYPRPSGQPTGVKPTVILRMFRELWRLKQAHGRA